MGHFSAAEWFEFARGPALAEGDAIMADHLERCAECQKVVNTWREVLEIGAREPSYSPPLDAVRSAKAAFGSQRRSWKWLRDVAEGARLMFDSLREPSPAEVRGSTVSTRQFLHEAKPFMIDVRVECEPAKNVTRLNGQVLNSNEPNIDVADVHVFLMKGENLATSTCANTSGEFELDFEDGNGLQLFVDIRGQKVVEIQLPTSLTDCDGTI